MDLDRRQRNDIDVVTDNRLTLNIDTLVTNLSSYEIAPERHEGYNWIVIDGKYTKYNIVEDDSLAFIFDPIPELSEKDINKVTVSFDYDANSMTLDSVSLSYADLVGHENVDYVLNDTGHVDIDCNIFGLSKEVLNNIITEQGFTIGLNIKGKRLNDSLQIWNVEVKFEYDNKLQDEMNAVANRISANFDTYVEEEDLVIEFLGTEGSGGGSPSGGGTDIETVNRLIKSAIDRISIIFSAELLDNGYMKISTELDKGDE